MTADESTGRTIRDARLVSRVLQRNTPTLEGVPA